MTRRHFWFGYFTVFTFAGLYAVARPLSPGRIAAAFAALVVYIAVVVVGGVLVETARSGAVDGDSASTPIA